MSHPLTVRRVLAGLAVSGLSIVLTDGVAAAQDSTSTTQLDVGGGGTTATTQLDTSGGSTATTQLDVGAGTATTTGAAPTQVEAGGGGTAGSAALPVAGIALAGAAVVVVGASAERMRRLGAR